MSENLKSTLIVCLTIIACFALMSQCSQNTSFF